MRQALAVAALFVLPLAGCLAPEAPAETIDAASLAAASPVAPALDAVALLADVQVFSESFPMRRGDNDAHNAAREDLFARFEAMGYAPFFDEFEAPVSPVSTPTNALGSGRLVNVCVVKWGLTAPEEWIVIGAHFDVTDGAIHGAYDDASGTFFVQHLAAAFKDVPTARSIVFCNFDGEEQGLRGSAHVVDSMANGDWVLENGTVVGMIDFDMAGIMFPAESPLVADVRSMEMRGTIEASVARLGIPEDAVEYRGISGGSSDNGPFKAAEIPSVLFISAFDEVRYRGVPFPSPAVKYPFWHQYDTYDGMVELAGGEADLEAGFQNVADIGSDLLAFMAGDVALTFSDESVDG